jgi:hypothetical protein
MTDQYTDYTVSASPQRSDAAPVPVDTAQLRAAALVFLTLVALGCVLGPVWSWWSPPGPLGERIPAGVIADETEAFIAGDGRFAVLTAGIGLLAGALAWCLRSVRGPWLVAALGLGGLVGAVLTDVVGAAVRGGGHAVAVTPDVARIAHLPLHVHATGLLLLEGAVAALLYGLFVAFTAHDDLGRPDPVRDSIRAGGHPHDSGGDGDTPGALQQGNLAPE